MVLQSNFAKRYVSNAENTPPTVNNVKPPLSRFHSTLNDAARRRRARTNGATRASKYSVEHAKRRNQSKPAVAIKVKVAPAPVVRDIDMTDASTSSAAGSEVSLPKYLGRPQFCDISRDALSAVDPALGDDVDIGFIRDELAKFGSAMLRGLASLKAAPAKDVLPKELTVTMQDLSAVPPSHMLAIYGLPTPSAPRRKVTLYPVHSVVLAAYCSKLPPVPSTSTASTSTPGSHTIPIKPLCLPSPSTYPHLASFLYTKRTDALFTSLLPSSTKPPASLLLSLSSPSSTDVMSYSTELAGVYTPQVLLQHTLVVHGLWQNVCALGIFDDDLWEVLDALWRVLLTAIAISTGNTSAMVDPDQ